MVFLFIILFLFITIEIKICHLSIFIHGKVDCFENSIFSFIDELNFIWVFIIYLNKVCIRDQFL